MPNTEQLLTSSNWKKQPSEVSFKKAVLKSFAIFTGKHPHKIIKNNYFEEHLHMVGSELTFWNDCLELCLWIAFKTILTR